MKELLKQELCPVSGDYREVEQRMMRGRVGSHANREPIRRHYLRELMGQRTFCRRGWSSGTNIPFGHGDTPHPTSDMRNKNPFTLCAGGDNDGYVNIEILNRGTVQASHLCIQH